MSNKSFWSRLPLHLFLIAAVGLIAYSNSFHVPFTFDDEGSIVSNNVIKNLNRFLHDDGYTYNPRRFLGYLTVALNYRLGGTDVTGYHAVNLAIHIGTGFLTYLLARLTLSTPALRRGDDATGASSWFIPLFAALLFVAHPVQTQAVTYIIQRLASLATLFFVGSIACYAKARKLQEESARPFAPKPLFFYLLALAAAGCAMKTKEIAFTLPFVVVLYEFMFFRMTAAKKLLFLLPVGLTVLIVPLSLLGTNKPIGQIISDVTAVTRVDSELSRLDYLFTQFPVIATYLRLLILPVRQNVDYDFPVYHSLANAPVILSLLLLLALFGAALFLWHRSRDPQAAPELMLVSFGILWFFITISVESSVIPIADVIFEHRVYLPSVGAFIALAALFSLLFKGAVSRAAVSIACVVVLALTVTTFARNSVWGSELSLWGDATQKSPRKARPHYNLALALEKSGRLEQSLQEALIATRLSPKEANPYNLIGSIFGKKGDYDQAIAALSLAVKLDPTLAEAQVNLGDAYRLKRMLPQAMEQYQAAMKQRPTDASIYHKIGVTFALQQNLPKAAVFFQCAASLDPSTPQYRLDLMRAQAGSQTK
ncbi:tetratricopeptide repeat protein [Geomonas subterranea]|uniref:Tetratricopeptide repeat protein n=1 Tax=Geomonas subterranea TaxID=2847989 RepID=A0ABX8LJS5_9BACT|nr:MULTISPECIES: tetratricopeptide repeat protein [Geomonas]QXE90899.1 tetratricopeptide repeat protein [Geomonas subterranea]QXM11016.1 tetratricopeptide repeat protein [Geomonas subterranea]